MTSCGSEVRQGAQKPDQGGQRRRAGVTGSVLASHGEESSRASREDKVSRRVTVVW